MIRSKISQHTPPGGVDFVFTCEMENFTKEEVVPDVVKETPNAKLTVCMKNMNKYGYFYNRSN